MDISEKISLSLTEEGLDFSKVARAVDENGQVIITKNNLPRYVVMEYAAAEPICTATDEEVESASERLIQKNLESYKELAK